MRLVLVCTIALACAVPAAAQVPESAAAEGQLVAPPAFAYNDLACGPILIMGRDPAPAPSLRVIGSQDTTARALYAHGDTIVISGGANAGLEPGQQYFVRRRVRTFSERNLPPTVHTTGWVRIVGVDTMLSTASVVHACDGILVDDYLEPFQPPQVAQRPLGGATPQFENMGHIVSGNEGVHTGGHGNLMTIDRGSDAGIVVGQRFLVFRDKRDLRKDLDGRSQLFAATASSMPLVEVGEIVVVGVRADHSTVQIIRARDAVTSGDLVAPLR